MSFIVGQRVLSASGGTISTITGYTVHTFTSSGSFTPNQNGTVEVLVVGAGGSFALIPAVPPAPGPSLRGGGGGGSVIYRKLVPVGAGVSYSIEIGQIDSPISTASTFTHPQGPITAPGGGSGTYTTTYFTGTNGVSNPVGSGGGAASGTGGGGIGGSGANVVGYGFSGGNGAGSYGAGGGGGAGGVGSSSTDAKGANGGIGVSYSITGSSLYYGVGGGGEKAFPWPGPHGYPNQNISLPIVSPYGRGKRLASPDPANPAAISDAGPGVVIIRYIN